MKEDNFIITITIITLFFLPVFIFILYSSTLNSPFISKEEAIDKASDFLISNQILEESKNYESSLILNLDEKGYSFLITEFRGKANAIAKELNLSLTTYSVLFKESNSQKAVVWLDANTGETVGFRDLQKKEKPEKTLTQEDILNLTAEYLTQKGYDTNQLIGVNFSTDYKEILDDDNFENKWNDIKNKSNTPLQTSDLLRNANHSLIFKINGTELNTSYGNSEAHIKIRIKGDKVTGFKGPFIYVPEKFINELEENSKKGQVLHNLSLFATFIMLILGLTVMIKGMIAKKIKCKFFLILSLIIFTLGILNTINTYSVNKNISYLISSTILTAIISTSIFIFGSAGNMLVKKIWKDKGVSLKKLIKSKPISKKYGISILKGYLFAIIMYVIILIIRFIGGAFFSMKAFPSPDAFNTFVSFSPVYSLFIIVLFAAIGEEITFRFFGISFFKDKVKSTFVAVLIPTIIWAVAHSNYSITPFYFRAIELTIMGLIFGYLFLRYNLVTVITIHFLFNIIASLSQIHLIQGTSGVIGGLSIASLPLIIALTLLIRSRKRKK